MLKKMLGTLLRLKQVKLKENVVKNILQKKACSKNKLKDISRFIKVKLSTAKKRRYKTG